MVKDQIGSRLGFGCKALALAIAAMGCTDSGAGKAWSSLNSCALGKAAVGDPAARMKQLRRLQLSNPGTDGKSDAWPARCATYANQLYAALESSGKQASLKRSMQSKLGCSEAKASCVLNNDTLLNLTGELAEGAKIAELKLEPVPGIEEPQATVEPLITSADWHPVNRTGAQLVGPEQTSDGSVHWLLKSSGERQRPTGCTFTPSSKQIECAVANEKVPALPPQSIQLVSDDSAIYAAGLTEEGLTAYNLKSGEAVAAKGMTGNLVRDGVAVERGAGDKGFVTIQLAKGKAGKPIELKSKGTITQPLSLGNQVIWLEPGEGGSNLVTKQLKGGRVVDGATLSGSFSGPFHVCKSKSVIGVASWAGHTGQRGAKPNAGSDGTQVTVTIFVDGAWSKPVEAKIPFKRAIESDLVCSAAGVTMAWAEPLEAGISVGQLSCDKSGCKTSDAKLANVDSRWWWSVGPIGDKILVLWRASLGEARMRLAPLGQLEQTKDVVLFDDPDHGGPKAGEVTSVFTADVALLLFKQEPPVALVIAADGSSKVVASK
jgi:hypothetical protein